jgi:hypothetical protein
MLRSATGYADPDDNESLQNDLISAHRQQQLEALDEAYRSNVQALDEAEATLRRLRRAARLRRGNGGGGNGNFRPGPLRAA